MDNSDLGIVLRLLELLPNVLVLQKKIPSKSWQSFRSYGWHRSTLHTSKITEFCRAIKVQPPSAFRALINGMYLIVIMFLTT